MNRYLTTSCLRVVKNVCRTRLHSADKERLLKRSKELKGVE